MSSLPTDRPDRVLVGPQRPSWCYGTPGLARAQQLAALALTDPRRQQLAEHALAGYVSDVRQLSQLRDASVCHGWAGLRHATQPTTDRPQPTGTGSSAPTSSNGEAEEGWEREESVDDGFDQQGPR